MLTIAGDDYKGTAVGVITLTGAVISLVAYPIVGILRFVCCERLQTFFDDRSDACAFSFLHCSDRTQVKKHHRFLPVGRRFPYVVVGVPLMAASMLAFPFLEHRQSVS